MESPTVPYYEKCQAFLIDVAQFKDAETLRNPLRIALHGAYTNWHAQLLEIAKLTGPNAEHDIITAPEGLDRVFGLLSHGIQDTLDSTTAILEDDNPNPLDSEKLLECVTMHVESLNLFQNYLQRCVFP
jgi:hypothetical protein